MILRVDDTFTLVAQQIQGYQVRQLAFRNGGPLDGQIENCLFARMVGGAEYCLVHDPAPDSLDRIQQMHKLVPAYIDKALGQGVLAEVDLRELVER